MTDMAVKVVCSSLERTQPRWTNLMTRVSLRVVNIWAGERDGLRIIEAEAELPEST